MHFFAKKKNRFKEEKNTPNIGFALVSLVFIVLVSALTCEERVRFVTTVFEAAIVTPLPRRGL